jgi:hypothetical protein
MEEWLISDPLFPSSPTYTSVTGNIEGYANYLLMWEEFLAETKVCKHYMSIWVNQNVLQLNVPIYDSQLQQTKGKQIITFWRHKGINPNETSVLGWISLNFATFVEIFIGIMKTEDRGERWCSRCEMGEEEPRVSKVTTHPDILSRTSQGKAFFRKNFITVQLPSAAFSWHCNVKNMHRLRPFFEAMFIFWKHEKRAVA